MGTTTSNSKSKSKKVSTTPETDDNTPTRVVDFSSGKPLIQVTIPQIITGIVFIFSIGWFVASQWIFDIKSERLKNEISDKINASSQDILKKSGDKSNLLDSRINEVENQLRDLRNKNSYLK